MSDKTQVRLFNKRQEGMQKRFSEKDAGMAFGNAFTNAAILVANHKSFEKLDGEAAVDAVLGVQRSFFEFSMEQRSEIKKGIREENEAKDGTGTPELDDGEEVIQTGGKGPF